MKPFIATAVVLCLLSQDALSAGSEPSWSYQGPRGPSTWGRLHKDWTLCSTGRRQAPINIVATQKENLPVLDFQYQPSLLRVLNDGHTVQVNVAPGSILKIGGDSYRLVEFHFHLPGEVQIKGKGFDMSMHLVHVNDAGEQAIVAVPFREGRKNEVLQPLWQNLPKVITPERVITEQQLNPAGLLPTKRGYYSFDGSLAVPPCSEGVRWFVLKEPVDVSKGQLFRLKAIFHKNARPVQPSNGRIVKESQ